MLIQLIDVSLAFGSDPLLDKVSFQIKDGEHAFLVGRNGAGKSSLLKVLEGSLAPDGGQVRVSPHTKLAMLPQSLPEPSDLSVFEFVAEGLESAGEALKQYYHLLEHKSDFEESEWLGALEAVQKEIELQDGWQYEQRIQSILTRLNLDGHAFMNTLSGGWRRRVSLARAFVSEPNILLLDEPTNHLDIDNILWLETQLKQFKGALICISHDRALVNKVATQIIELDRGHLYTYQGDLTAFLKYKEKRLEDEAKANQLFDKKLAEEETWIRQGIKARRTRNEGRVRALQALRKEHQERRVLLDKPSFNFSQSDLSGRLVIDAKNIGFQYGEKPIIDTFSARIFRGDKIGFIGPNGCGKSTLLKLLLGVMPPQSGTVKLGTNLKVAYFDQLRMQLAPELSAIDNVAEGRSTIEVNGKSKHIISYLGDFLFTPDRARLPVSRLSGGECNRVLLARLFSLPANVLVLDEPTNDLDVETLELLEDILTQYEGTILLVSHDRAFMDNVVSEVFAFDEDGSITSLVGGYSDWKAYQANRQATKPVTITPNSSLKSDKVGSKADKPKKLSYHLQQELNQLPAQIEALEMDIEALQTEISDPAFYQQEQSVVDSKLKALSEKESSLEKAYQRWEELDSD